MANFENPYKEGYLWIPPSGMLSKLKKSWQKRYCRLFKFSQHGIKRIEVFDGVENKKLSMIISLKNCVKIIKETRKHQLNVFSVWTKTSTYIFSANSEQEMDDWLYKLQTVAFRRNISSQTFEDNDLYYSLEDDGVFNVQLISSDASQRCGLKEKTYILVITSVSLQLWESNENNKLCLTWPYTFIRRYGYKTDQFSFEAGRKCLNGEGIFHFKYSNQKEIFKCISSKIQKIKEILINNKCVSPLLCNNNQVKVTTVLSSHNHIPHPLNANTTQLILDHNLLTNSCLTKSLIPKPSLLNAQHTLLTKSPTKIPKKLKPYVIYEEVKTKNNFKKPYNNMITLKNIENSIENYDHLQHFGFLSKTGSNYKQINSISLTSKHKPYMIIPKSPLTPARKADDSHYGYGTINKTFTLQ